MFYVLEYLNHNKVRALLRYNTETKEYQHWVRNTDAPPIDRELPEDSVRFYQEMDTQDSDQVLLRPIGQFKAKEMGTSTFAQAYVMVYSLMKEKQVEFFMEHLLAEMRQRSILNEDGSYNMERDSREDFVSYYATVPENHKVH